MSAVLVKDMTAAVKQLNSESYKRLIEGCNGKFISVTALTRDTNNRELLEEVYSKIKKLPNTLTFEPDIEDHTDDDDITLGSFTSKGDLELEKQLKKLTIENARLKKENKALTGAASSHKKKPTPHFKTLEEIQKMTGEQMNVHINTLKDEYGEDAFKAAVERMNTNMTGIKKAAVKERASLIVDLQDQLE
jgi:ribosomal protein L29